jgi:hypothetical protein
MSVPAGRERAGAWERGAPLKALQCSPMKKDADLRGAEVTPSSGTSGTLAGMGVGLHGFDAGGGSVRDAGGRGDGVSTASFQAG